MAGEESIKFAVISGGGHNCQNDIYEKKHQNSFKLQITTNINNIHHFLGQVNGLLRMARGQQKLQSQAKAAERAAKVKKQMGHSSSDQKKAAQKALVYVCAVCKAQMPDPKTYKQHFENKHPKNEVPAELKDV